MEHLDNNSCRIRGKRMLFYFTQIEAAQILFMEPKTKPTEFAMIEAIVTASDDFVKESSKKQEATHVRDLTDNIRKII